jgi:hypothetical protein
MSSLTSIERFSEPIEAANVLIPAPLNQSSNSQFCKRCLTRKNKSQFIKEKKLPSIPLSELENYVWNDRPSSDFYKQCLNCRNHRKLSIARQIAKRREETEKSKLEKAGIGIYSWTQLLNEINEGYFLYILKLILGRLKSAAIYKLENSILIYQMIFQRKTTSQ